MSKNLIKFILVLLVIFFYELCLILIAQKIQDNILLSFAFMFIWTTSLNYIFNKLPKPTYVQTKT